MTLIVEHTAEDWDRTEQLIDRLTRDGLLLHGGADLAEETIGLLEDKIKTIQGLAESQKRWHDAEVLELRAALECANKQIEQYNNYIAAQSAKPQR